LGRVVDISKAPRRQRIARSSEAPNSHPVACRVPASIFRKMAEMVEVRGSMFKTKSDILVEGLELVFEREMTLNPDDPSWAPFRLARERDLRQQRKSDLAMLSDELSICKSEGDMEGMKRLLIHTRKFKGLFTSELASHYEMSQLDGIIGQVCAVLGITQ